MLEIQRGTSDLPTVHDVTDEDMRVLLDPHAKGVLELRTNHWLAGQVARLEKRIAGDDPIDAALARCDLSLYLTMRDCDKSRELAETALGIGEEADDPRVIAAAKRGIGRAHAVEYDLQRAAALSLEAEYLFNDIGDRVREGEAMVQRMFVAMLTGAYAAAASLAGPILDLLEQPSDEDDEYIRLLAISHVHGALAYVAREVQNDTEMCRLYSALHIAYGRAAPEPLLVGAAHSSLGLMSSGIEDYDASRSHYTRALQIVQKHGSVFAEIRELGHLAAVAASSRDFGGARELLAEADRLIECTPGVSRFKQIAVNSARTVLLIEQERWDEAETLLFSVKSDVERSPRRNTIITLQWLIRVYKGKRTIHEHLDLYDRLVDEMQRSANERGATQLGALRTQRDVEQRKRQQRADTLLRAIIPPSAYSELVTSGESAPRYYPDTVIFFSDFAGFTKIAAALTPRQVIEELSDLFDHFDQLMSESGCQRIETIGDAYLAVSGLDVRETTSGDERRRVNAANIVRAALSIQEYLNERNYRARELGGPQFAARIGIHCGPLIGGIVGRDRVRYGVFGDVVNTAKRLESACDPADILVSESIYNALVGTAAELRAALVDCEPIEVKGKGRLRVWSVRRRN